MRSVADRWADWETSRRDPTPAQPDDAVSHGVLCLAGPLPWSAEWVESGQQCQCIHPQGKTPYGWVCLACNHGNEPAERMAARFGAPVGIVVEEKDKIEFKPKKGKRKAG